MGNLTFKPIKDIRQLTIRFFNEKTFLIQAGNCNNTFTDLLQYFTLRSSK